MEHKEERSLASLISDLTRETSDLMRQEVALAKTEISAKVNEVKTGLVALVIAAALFIVGLIYILNAVVYGIAELLPEDLSPWLAALIVGVISLVVGYSLLKKGQEKLEPSNLAPKRTVNQLQEDKNLVKEQIQ